MYDFHQYSYTPEKICIYKMEPFECFLSKIYKYTNSKCIFTLRGVPKKWKNAMKWAKNWDK